MKSWTLSRLLAFTLGTLAAVHPAEIIDGTLTARGPGLGLEWNEAAVAKYLMN